MKTEHHLCVGGRLPLSPVPICKSMGQYEKQRLNSLTFNFTNEPYKNTRGHRTLRCISVGVLVPGKDPGTWMCVEG